VFSLALSAIDMACWDLRGKAEGKSVCELLASARSRADVRQRRITAPASDRLPGGGRSAPGRLGFRQMKMQCGSEPNDRRICRTVRVMRDAIGPDVDLMCDINQLWSVQHAIAVGDRIEP